MDPKKSLIRQFGEPGESARRRYQRIFVGSDSVADLVRYELLTGLLGPMPGALGYALRKRIWPALFGGVGRGVVFGRNITLRAPGHVRLGDNVLVDDYAVLDAKGDHGRIEVGSTVLIGRDCILSCTEASITIGDCVSIGPRAHFASKSFIRIGSHIGIGPDVQVIAGGYNPTDPGRPPTEQERVSNGITIEDNVWIGVGARILDGVTIGHDSIIGAAAVVTKDVPPLSVFVGNPGRVIKSRDRRQTARA